MKFNKKIDNKFKAKSFIKDLVYLASFSSSLAAVCGFFACLDLCA